jgi:hypothetical protein
MAELRGSPRLRTFKGGSIIFGMSDRGAALEVESPVGIPDDFTLLIKPEFVKRNCHVVWRASKRIGVRFT